MPKIKVFPKRDRDCNIRLLVFLGLLMVFSFFSGHYTRLHYFSGVAWYALIAFSFFLLNLLFLKWTFYPYDFIRSAFSPDGVKWKKERGIRVSFYDDERGIANFVYSPCVIEFEDKMPRMYFYTSPIDSNNLGFIASAISPDGLAWQRQGKIKTDATDKIMKFPCIIRMPEGVWRMYYASSGDDKRFSIYSLISNDGASWKKEAGMRFGIHDIPRCGSLETPWVVLLKDKRYRMYISDRNDSHSRIITALSGDGLVWHFEKELQVAAGEAGLIGARVVFDERNDCWRMFYSCAMSHGFFYAKILTVVSHDGLNWDSDIHPIILPGGLYDSIGVYYSCPQILKDGQGYRLFYTAAWGPCLKITPILKLYLQVARNVLKKHLCQKKT